MFGSESKTLIDFWYNGNWASPKSYFYLPFLVHYISPTFPFHISISLPHICAYLLGVFTLASTSRVLNLHLSPNYLLHSYLSVLMLYLRLLKCYRIFN